MQLHSNTKYHTQTHTVTSSTLLISRLTRHVTTTYTIQSHREEALCLGLFDWTGSEHSPLVALFVSPLPISRSLRVIDCVTLAFTLPLLPFVCHLFISIFLPSDDIVLLQWFSILCSFQQFPIRYLKDMHQYLLCLLMILFFIYLYFCLWILFSPLAFLSQSSLFMLCSVFGECKKH